MERFSHDFSASSNASWSDGRAGGGGKPTTTASPPDQRALLRAKNCGKSLHCPSETREGILVLSRQREKVRTGRHHAFLWLVSRKTSMGAAGNLCYQPEASGRERDRAFMYVTPLKLIRTFVPRCRRHLWIYLVNFCGMESRHFSLPLSLRQRLGVKCNL